MSPKIHLIANSHIDPVWLWDRFEGIDEVINTFRSAHQRLDDYPQLHFSASSTQFYEWVFRYDPELFERIKGKVSRGRWEITGGWWIEPDCNLPTSASFYKQAEISQQFVNRHFGKCIEVAFVPDSFGHSAPLPRILSETGFKYYIFCRPNESEKQDLPANLFYWEYKGHRVLCCRLKFGYTHGRQLDKETRLRELSDPEFSKTPVSCYFFGVGDHGGGPSIEEIEFYSETCAGNKDVSFSTCLNFFKQAEKLNDIPTYSGDLFYHAVGCYSVVRDLRDAVRKSEYGLCFTERALQMNGESAEKLNPLWKKTLFNQFHDIMGGSSSQNAVHQACCELGNVEDSWRTHAYGALKNLSIHHPVKVREGEFRIFNTLPNEVTVPLVIESFAYFEENAPFKDETGKEITIQEVTPDVRCVNRRWEFVDSLPASGFKSYYFDRQQIASNRKCARACFEAGNEISTPDFGVESPGIIMGNIDTSTRNKKNLLKNPVTFLVLDDQTDTWAHGVSRFDGIAGSFRKERSSIAKGPVVSKLYEHLTYNRSTIDLIYSLYQELPCLYMDVKVSWGETRKILKCELEPDFHAVSDLIMQAPGGFARRPVDGKELPMHSWILLKGNVFDLGIAQEGAFSCDCEGAKCRLTLVRSSLYGYDRGTVLNPHEPQNHTDQGEHFFRFCIIFRKDLTAEWLEAVTNSFLEPYPVIREGIKTA